MNSKITGSEAVQIEGAVVRLASRPGFLAHVFSIAFAGDVSMQRVAEELRCPTEMALRVSLMRAPRIEQKTFRNDVERIVEETSIDKTRFLAIVRQAQSIEALAQTNSQILLAARDSLAHSDSEKDAP